MKPLFQLLKKGEKCRWTEEHESFNELTTFREQPVFCVYNHEVRTLLHTDVSQLVLSGVLLQEQRDNIRSY